ncbi:acyl dehydratase [Pullulanibacillus pueri]|uniref:MaoC family dehydratase n=1 Tax=Pullulanibacillus pueri TaxID=1437324 RepID=A0A8J2ZZP3_9BACL|nr:MaoC family dehydratase [Pullulanibacillus pueri]MBM7683301.1 acyl dehydratase [Pullulanibacillus pueri]GGH86459.1 MaoC family dehydratase [Pullulanibacillus pueri]
MSKVPLKIGDHTTFTKTISESDVYMFVGITGDFNRFHIDEEYMKSTKFEQRIAPGLLSVGFSTAAATALLNDLDMGAVSYGYDKLRFIRPTFIGDTITVQYTVKDIDDENLTAISNVRIYNQHGKLCTSIKHIVKFFEL